MYTYSAKFFLQLKAIQQKHFTENITKYTDILGDLFEVTTTEHGHKRLKKVTKSPGPLQLPLWSPSDSSVAPVPGLHHTTKTIACQWWGDGRKQSRRGRGRHLWHGYAALVHTQPRHIPQRNRRTPGKLLSSSFHFQRLQSQYTPPITSAESFRFPWFCEEIRPQPRQTIQRHSPFASTSKEQ